LITFDLVRAVSPSSSNEMWMLPIRWKKSTKTCRLLANQRSTTGHESRMPGPS